MNKTTLLFFLQTHCLKPVLDRSCADLGRFWCPRCLQNAPRKRPRNEQFCFTNNDYINDYIRSQPWPHVYHITVYVSSFCAPISKLLHFKIGSFTGEAHEDAAIFQSGTRRGTRVKSTCFIPSHVFWSGI